MENPLKQHFRRPAIYLKLPSEGKFYPPGAIDLPENKEIPIYPMTAIDEITSKTPDALFNGLAVVEVIKSCAPNIKDPWHIPSIDLDAILIAIKSATGGNDLEITSDCPACNTQSNYTINMVGLLSNVSSGDYSRTFEIGELVIKFQPLSYKTVNKISLIQFELERKMKAYNEIEDQELKAKHSSDTMREVTILSTNTIAETIQSITTNSAVVDNKEYIVEFLKNCDSLTYETIRKQVVELRESSELKPLKIKCIHCSNEYQQPLAFNISDFFG